ncbi:MAG: PD-(D/E)XK nuclease family protein [Micropruina sp.]
MSAAQWVDVATIPRDRWQRPMIIPPDGGKPVAYTRATTFAGSIKETNALMEWKARQTAIGLATRPDLAARVAAAGPEPDDEAKAKAWKADLGKLCASAQEAAGSSTKSNLGTALHAFTEAVNRGRTDVVIPEQYLPHIAAYQEATQGWRMLGIEAFLVEDEYQIGGTADRIAEVPGLGLVIADVKSGAKIAQYPHEAAGQLSIYAHSKRYDPATGARTPIDGLRTDVGVIIALNAATGKCDLHLINLIAGWESVRLCAEVRAWRRKKDLLQPLRPAPRPDRRTQVALQVAIAEAPTRDELIALWQAADARGQWSDELTELARTRMTTLLATA